VSAVSVEPVWLADCLLVVELKVAKAPASVEAYRSAWPRLVRLGRLLTGSLELGEDLAQEAWFGLLRKGEVDNVDAYLRRSIVNLAINARRRSARERQHLSSLTEGAVWQPDPDDLWPLVVALPARQRAALVLRYYEDLSEAEIAKVLGCRPGTVKSLTSRALARLRDEVTR
jgi:RNA polymerase sigma factor (sigma-70 family)